MYGFREHTVFSRCGVEVDSKVKVVDQLKMHFLLENVLM